MLRSTQIQAARAISRLGRRGLQSRESESRNGLMALPIACPTCPHLSQSDRLAAWTFAHQVQQLVIYSSYS
jgi:hypothetical protein